MQRRHKLSISSVYSFSYIIKSQTNNKLFTLHLLHHKLDPVVEHTHARHQRGLRRHRRVDQRLFKLNQTPRILSLLLLRLPLSNHQLVEVRQMVPQPGVLLKLLILAQIASKLELVAVDVRV